MLASKARSTIVSAILFAVAVMLIMAGCSAKVDPSATSADSTGLSFGSESAGSAGEAESVVMTLAGSKDTYVLVGEDYVESGCQAVDRKKGAISNTVQAEGSVDTSAPGDYEVTYTATTKDGKTAQATRNVHVVESFDKEAKSIPVLMYHFVYTEDRKPENLNGNYILDTKLGQECKYLVENDYYFPSFQELRAWVDGKLTLPAKSVIVTFDDGHPGFLKYGIPVLEEYQVPATSFLIGKNYGKAKVKKYASEYVQFQSHSFNMHRPGGNQGRGGIIYAYSKQDVMDDAAKNNKVTGNAVAFAYPFGDNDEKAQAALDESGILCAFTIVNDRIHKGDNPMLLNRVRISGDYSVDSFKALVAPN